MITIIDYGMGNLLSVSKAFENLGFDTLVTQKPEEVLNAKKVVFPGVGHFGKCMENLKKLKLLDSVRDVIDKNVPFLGICVGLQQLFEKSEESETEKGIAIFEGTVNKFKNRTKVPHMGWNQLNIVQDDCPLLKGITSDDYFYFTHSYYVDPSDKNIILSQTDYEGEFVSAIWKGNVFATQFHPEKSQDKGLKIIKNFGEYKA